MEGAIRCDVVPAPRLVALPFKLCQNTLCGERRAEGGGGGEAAEGDRGETRLDGDVRWGGGRRVGGGWDGAGAAEMKSGRERVLPE